ncbi:MAG: hypothetical protein Ct9H300mP19_18510 [Dehalococcoidia bacterium]|nr:MAG: hypothetical protein Ct9H300mP19_18510 [Dehalococcoidia bacterium]
MFSILVWVKHLKAIHPVGAAVGDLQKISGQKPIENRAKMSIANFKLREGSVVGTSVTLRGNRMWQFYDRFVNIPSSSCT